MSETAQKPRRQYRNVDIPQILTTFRFPPAAKTSILHRISGALLFLALPIILVPLFAASVTSPESFQNISAWVSNPLCKLVLLVLMWGYLHHFCAGIRYLLLDLHKGDSRESSQRSASVVIGVSLALTFIFGLKLFGVW